MQLYFLLIRLASLWNKKARLWINGRKDLFSNLEKGIRPDDRVIWVHCSSAGEFEQGKPVIEKLKETYPSHKLVISFFSPSGFQVARNYTHADLITYLPLDTESNAKKLLKTLHPELVLFIKYEFWYHFLSQAAYRHVPVLLLSAVFRKDQLFFRSYGRFYRQVLFLFRHIFVQDKNSRELLKDHGINHCSISGDTRFDRVLHLSAQQIHMPVIENFVAGEKLMVAGSTWPKDEELLAQAWDVNSAKLLIAPHEINESHLEDIQKNFPGALRYSMFRQLFEEENSLKGIWDHINKEEKSALLLKLQKARILVLDNVGYLSRIYKYADIAFVGGGFSRDGIHNVLEPAAFNNPVIFGPNFQKYREAKDLIATGGAISVTVAGELKSVLEKFWTDHSYLENSGKTAASYVRENGGASEKIVGYIQENRLLTN